MELKQFYLEPRQITSSVRFPVKRSYTGTKGQSYKNCYVFIKFDTTNTSKFKLNRFVPRTVKL